MVHYFDVAAAALIWQERCGSKRGFELPGFFLASEEELSDKRIHADYDYGQTLPSPTYLGRYLHTSPFTNNPPPIYSYGDKDIRNMNILR